MHVLRQMPLRYFFAQWGEIISEVAFKKQNIFDIHIILVWNWDHMKLGKTRANFGALEFYEVL